MNWSNSLPEEFHQDFLLGQGWVAQHESVGFIEALAHYFWNVVSSLNHSILLGLNGLYFRLFLFLLLFSNHWLDDFFFLFRFGLWNFHFFFNLLFYFWLGFRNFDLFFSFFLFSASPVVMILELMGKVFPVLSAFCESSPRLFGDMVSKQTSKSINALINALVETWKRNPFTVNFDRLIRVINNSENLNGSLMEVLDLQEGMGVGAFDFTIRAHVKIRADHTLVSDSNNRRCMTFITSDMSVDNFCVHLGFLNFFGRLFNFLGFSFDLFNFSGFLNFALSDDLLLDLWDDFRHK